MTFQSLGRYTRCVLWMLYLTLMETIKRRRKMKPGNKKLSKKKVRKKPWSKEKFSQNIKKCGQLNRPRNNQPPLKRLKPCKQLSRRERNRKRRRWMWKNRSTSKIRRNIYNNFSLQSAAQPLTTLVLRLFLTKNRANKRQQKKEILNGEDRQVSLLKNSRQIW